MAAGVGNNTRQYHEIPKTRTIPANSESETVDLH